MPLSSLDICSRALVKIGANSISSFDDGSTEAHVAGNLYPFIRDGLLSLHPWNFAIAQARLPKLAVSPLADFSHAFALPVDCLRVISAGSEGRGQGLTYRIRERQLHSHSDSVMLTYLFRPPEAEFPAYFNLALIARLAAEFCIPLTDSTSRWKNLMDAADAQFRAAKLSDALEDTPPAIQDFTLIEGRV